MNFYENEGQVMFAEQSDKHIIDEHDNKRKDRLRAVVTRIGEQPLLKIEGGVEIRFAYRNVKKKHGDARPQIQVGDNVECRLTKSNPPKAVSVRLMKKNSEAVAEAKPSHFVHDPYSVDPTTSAANITQVNSQQLCDVIDAGDVDAAVDGCLSEDHQINGLISDYYPSSYCSKKVAEDSKYCLAYQEEFTMLTAFDYGY